MTRSFKKIASISFFLAIAYLPAFTQTKEEKRAAQEALTKQLVESQEFEFSARTMNPTGGRSRLLTGSSYGITVSTDSVISDLPYIGRAYSAPIGSAGGGISFTSVDFDLTTSPDKRGGWTIRIKPKDISDIREVTLIITASGNTTVNVLSNSRQSISYNGDLVERKKN